MSLSENQSFKSALEEELIAAGLSVSSKDIIGRSFRFGSEHGSHHEVLCGTILAVGISDESGLELYVSSPRFFGKRLISIIRSHRHNAWMACIETTPDRDPFFLGELELL